MLRKLLLLMVIGAVLWTGICSAAVMSPRLEFTPTNVYFADNMTLAVEGKLWNSGNAWNSADYVSSAGHLDLKIKLKTEQGERTVKQTFAKVDVGLAGGSYCSRVFYISNIDKTAITSWEVNSRFY